MKLVFLDIDGPMNTRNNVLRCGESDEKFFYDFEGRKVCQLDKDCINNLNSLLDKTGAKLVICSSWRVGTKPDWFTRLLRNEGLTHNVIGHTPELDMQELDRGHEIEAYIKYCSITEPVETWLVIDDTASELSRLHPDNVVLVDTKSGFNSTHLQRAIRLLNK